MTTTHTLIHTTLSPPCHHLFFFFSQVPFLRDHSHLLLGEGSEDGPLLGGKKGKRRSDKRILHARAAVLLNLSVQSFEVRRHLYHVLYLCPLIFFSVSFLF